MTANVPNVVEQTLETPEGHMPLFCLLYKQVNAGTAVVNFGNQATGPGHVH